MLYTSPGKDRIVLHSTFILRVVVVAMRIELMSLLNEFHVSWALTASLKEHQVKDFAGAISCGH